MTASSAATPPLHMRRAQFDPDPQLLEIGERTRVHVVQDAFGIENGIPVYMLTRQDDAKAVLADPKRFSSQRPPGFAIPGAPAVSEAELRRAQAGNLLSFDPPQHTRLRRMLSGEFTARRMKRLEQRIIEIVDNHLDMMERGSAPSDLIANFALPIPSLVICELLGVPYEDRDEFQRRTAAQLDLLTPPQERFDLRNQSRAYMQTLVTAARRTPGEDMLGMLVREHGDDLSDEELVGICSLLLVAGHETTSSMLGLGTLALLQNPQQLAAVRDDPTAIAPAIEELLRWLSIVHNSVQRFTTEEVEIGGVQIPKGQLAMVSLPLANRDPDVVDEPGILNIHRGVASHLAFGHGIHYCLGAPLARMEMRIAFPALLRRFRGLELAEPLDEVAFRSFHVVYGLQSLKVRW